MKELMRTHLRKYPKMQVVDMVKLLYQSEFAGGHMVSDAAESLSRLTCEYEGLKPSDTAEAFEDIGGGLCRLHLGALSTLGIQPQTVNRMFVATANTEKGSTVRFDAKLDEFLACCHSGELPFAADEAEAYIRNYRIQSCPPVSHSAAYRAAYAPAYRVIKAAYCRFLDVFRRIDALLDQKASVNVAIDGNSGAGKSTLAFLLAEVYDCNVFHTDDFFLPPISKTAARLAEPGGNVDYERLRNEVIAGFKSGEPFGYRTYDCQSGTLSAPVQVSPKRLNILEGVYSLHPALDISYELSIFLKADSTTQRTRILKRSGAALLKRFEAEWIPLENRYFYLLHIIQKCDIVHEGEFSLDGNDASCI
jgi:hypothetical protein